MHLNIYVMIDLNYIINLPLNDALQLNRLIAIKVNKYFEIIAVEFKKYTI